MFMTNCLYRIKENESSNFELFLPWLGNWWRTKNTARSLRLFVGGFEQVAQSVTERVRLCDMQHSKRQVSSSRDLWWEFLSTDDIINLFFLNSALNIYEYYVAHYNSATVICILSIAVENCLFVHSRFVQCSIYDNVISYSVYWQNRMMIIIITRHFSLGFIHTLQERCKVNMQWEHIYPSHCK